MTLAITELRDRTGGAELADAEGDPFEFASDERTDPWPETGDHIIKEGIRCDTERKGSELPRGHSALEIVLDASEGFVPLWAKDSTLRWRFRKRTLRAFRQPKLAQAAIERLLGEAILAWGSAAPIKFAQSNSAWDFEIVIRPGDNCNPNGCVLASAFFPDAGRHELVIYPKMFTQPREEQVETLVHEIGHIFGLRHFFALVSEKVAGGGVRRASSVQHHELWRAQCADRRRPARSRSALYAGVVRTAHPRQPHTGPPCSSIP